MKLAWGTETMVLPDYKVATEITKQSNTVKFIKEL